MTTACPPADGPDLPPRPDAGADAAGPDAGEGPDAAVDAAGPLCETVADGGPTACTPSADEVAFNAADNPSMAFDALSRAHVALHGNGFLAYAQRAPGGAWTREFPDAPEGGNTGHFPSLALDSAGGVHVLYAEAGLPWQIKYGYRAPGGAWTLSSVTSGNVTSLVVDAADRLHAAFASGGELRYLRREPGGLWLPEVVEPWTDYEVALAVDASGGVALAYRQGAVPDRTLRYATRDPAGTWTFETLFAGAPSGLVTGLYPAIVFDGTGTVHVVHYVLEDGTLRHAQRAPGGAWVHEIVGPATAGEIAVRADSGGALHVVYDFACPPVYGEPDTLMYARRSAAGDWTFLPMPAGYEVSWGADLALDGAGDVSIAYGGFFVPLTCP